MFGRPACKVQALYATLQIQMSCANRKCNNTAQTVAISLLHSEESHKLEDAVQDQLIIIDRLLNYPTSQVAIITDHVDSACLPVRSP